MARIRKDNDQRYLLQADGPFAKLNDNGKLEASVLPSLAITETFIVANTAERLALTAQTGDIAIQSDNGLTYILYGTDPSVDGDWIELTSTETDPVFTASPAFGITNTNITQWNTAYGWGDHASAGYLTSFTETDTLDSVTDRGATTTNAITTGAITTTGRLYVNEGQSASYVRLGNTGNTGGYIGYGTPSSTSLSLWTNGNVQAMTIDGTGNVGIGTTSPSRLLTLSGSGATLLSLVSTDDDNCQVLFGDSASDTVGKILYRHSGNSMAFETNAAEAMRINSSGNVGIGNTDPQRKLSVHESASGAGCWAQFTNASTGTSSGAGTLVGIDGSGTFRILNYEATRLRFYTNGTDRMQVNDNGSIHAASDTGASYLMWLTNSATSAGQGQVLRLHASGRSTGTRDIDVFEIQNADGRIHGVRNDGQTYMQATSSSAIKAKTSNYATVFGVLPWNGSYTYLSSGAYYDDGVWVHASQDTTSTLLGLSGDGVSWYASSNSSATWNQASNVQLWDASGQWTGFINTSYAAYVGTLNVLSSASTNSVLAGTGSSTYVAFRSNSTTTRGYVGNGPGLLTGAANSDFIVRSQATLKFAVNGNNLGATLSASGAFTATGDITGANLGVNQGDYGSVVVKKTRGGYYGLSLNGHAVFMSNGSAHGIYDDVNNDWWVRFYENARVALHYNGAEKLATTSVGVSVTGSMTASGEVTAFSDARLKSNIQTLDGSKVYQMRGVSYDKEGVASSGVIAQELQEVAPELVHEGEEYLSVAYGNMVGYLIEAIKDLKAEVEELKRGNTDKQTSESVNGSD